MVGFMGKYVVFLMRRFVLGNMIFLVVSGICMMDSVR